MNEEAQFNVLLTTDAFIMKDKGYLKRFEWKYLIVDEAHRLKNPRSKLVKLLNSCIQSQYRLALTGTPLQNDLQELWSLLNFLMPTVFNSSDTFESWFQAPIGGGGGLGGSMGGGGASSSAANQIAMNEEEKLLIIDRLHKVLRPFVLRREKREVENEVPAKQEEIIWCELSGTQKRMYDEIHKSEGGQNVHMQLQKLCNHPYLFASAENIPGDDSLIRVCGKFQVLDCILPKLKACGHRTLIFSQMTRLMDLLEIFLNLRRIHYLRLDGHTSSDDRQKRLTAFNAPDSRYFCFILSTKAGGLGVNLQTADTVIIFDSDWNPQNDEQAQSRAHRIGQTQTVLTLRLITPGTVEEKVLSTASVKLNKDDLIIKGGMFNESHMGKGAERHQWLRERLRKEGPCADENVTDLTQLNRCIARSDDEVVLFDHIDRKFRMLRLNGLFRELLIPECLLGWQSRARLTAAKVVESLCDRAESAKEWRLAYYCPDKPFAGFPDNATMISGMAPKEFRERLNIAVAITVDRLIQYPEIGPFIDLPDDKIAPDYYNVVKMPISLKGIHGKAEAGKYPSLGKLESDLARLTNNCFKYNGFNHPLAIVAAGIPMQISMAVRRCLFIHSKRRKNKDADPDEFEDDGDQLLSTSEYIESLNDRGLIASEYLASSESSTDAESDLNDDDDDDDEIIENSIHQMSSATSSSNVAEAVSCSSINCDDNFIGMWPEGSTRVVAAREECHLSPCGASSNHLSFHMFNDNTNESQINEYMEEFNETGDIGNHLKKRQNDHEDSRHSKKWKGDEKDISDRGLCDMSRSIGETVMTDDILQDNYSDKTPQKQCQNNEEDIFDFSHLFSCD
eukprot:GHVL01031482.1.p1 GENE.GHVL01031482.1~~GHVL01031482.1.p1  ORF type:complete len:848 (+),score=188.98 GHVL01031482.1:1341-3884(+)